MAQRALIIGLGSTGYDVCKQLVERVQWEHGGLDKTPWLKILVLETEPLTGDGPLERNGIHLSVPKDEYAKILNRPGDYKDRFDPQGWFDAETLLPLGTTGVTKGAGNIRMVGRLTLLYNMQAVRDAVSARLSELSLGPLQLAIAQAGINPASAPLSSNIVVYVVGTLLGGTCSGGFIDLGYLLHDAFGRLAPAGEPIERVGIFSLPHPGYDANRWQRRRANAWAALNELNHYMAGHPYRARYLNHPVEVASVTPFDTTYLLQPRDGSPAVNGLDWAFEELQVVTSQFLHAEVFTANTAQIGARTVDRATNMSQGDINGSPQGYATFGISSVEIPGYLIAQGCCYRLGAEALDKYLGPRPNASAEADAFRVNRLGLSSEKLADRLFGGDPSNPDDRALKDRAQDEIRGAMGNARNAGSAAGDVLQALEGKLSLALAPRAVDGPPPADEAVNSALPPHIVALRAASNSSGLASSYRARVSDEMQRALLDIERGPAWCSVVLHGCQAWLQARLSELGAPDAMNTLDNAQRSAQNGLIEARERVAACAGDPFVALFGGRKAAVSRHLDEYETAASTMWSSGLEAILRRAERELWSKLLPWVSTVKARIDGPGQDNASLLERAQALQAELRSRAQVADGTTPRLNGTAIFEKNKTIGKAYDKTWADADGGSLVAAQQQFLLGWPDLPAVNQDAGTAARDAFFEPPTIEMKDDDLKRHESNCAEAMARAARRHFEAATAESVAPSVVTGGPQKLQQVWASAAPLLRVNRQHAGFDDAAASDINLVMLYPRDRPSLEPLVNGMAMTGITQIEGAASPQSVAFVRAYGGFPLAIIEGFQQQEQGNFRYSFEQQRSGRSQIWSRLDPGDGGWQPFYGDVDPDSEWRKGLFLSALALPRATPNGASAGSIIAPGAGCYVYTPPRPFGPGEHSITLPNDLRAIARLLRSREDVQVQLQQDMAHSRARLSAEEAAQKLHHLYTHIGQLGLSNSKIDLARNLVRDAANGAANGQANAANGASGDAAPRGVGASQAYTLMLQYWKHDAEISTLLKSIYEREGLMYYVKLHENEPGFMHSGYYCHHESHASTPQFLAPTIELLPERCPLCKNLCR